VDRSLRTDSFEHALENEDGKAKLKDRVRQILKNIRHGNVVTSMFGLNDNAPHSGRNIAKNRRVSVQTIHNWKLEAYKKVKSNYDEEEFYDYLPS
jgi:DNA-directed RNA polymerase sigma subunit (sigma70/sigma32)